MALPPDRCLFVETRALIDELAFSGRSHLMTKRYVSKTSDRASRATGAMIVRSAFSTIKSPGRVNLAHKDGTIAVDLSGSILAPRTAGIGANASSETEACKGRFAAWNGCSLCRSRLRESCWHYSKRRGSRHRRLLPSYRDPGRPRSFDRLARCAAGCFKSRECLAHDPAAALGQGDQILTQPLMYCSTVRP